MGRTAPHRWPAGELVQVAPEPVDQITCGLLQLDIHTQMVDFLTYPAGADRTAYGVKLLPDMAGGANRYLLPDQRDFFAVTLR